MPSPTTTEPGGTRNAAKAASSLAEEHRYAYTARGEVELDGWLSRERSLVMDSWSLRLSGRAASMAGDLVMVNEGRV